ncbi:MAG: caspase family protein [Desmonostoc vinosum HA7617-LM4]|jgi:hypothetical protein|nr:caspase family protein [Desmonostoc vinosum HA7617-LM4]
MKRRTFLQRIGSILAILGVTEAEWLTLGNHYYQALAQPNLRKLALLIGINQYQKIPSLSGCLTDVELQRELLMYRFGFQGSDILTLTEEQASREFIEAAFLDHFGKQAKPGDVVFFHFSGYGTRIKLEMLSEAQNALVPASENQVAQDEKIVNYLLEETLLLLLRSLPTDKVIAVLDTSYNAPTTVQPTGLRIRARQELEAAQLAAQELEFLKQLKTQDSKFNPLILTATSEPKQLAREALLSGLSAGLFTYALTQYLWETTPATTIQVVLSHVSSSLHKLGSKQQPGLLSNQKNLRQLEMLNVASVLGQPNNGAEGTVTAIEEDGKTVHLWLGGLPTQVLEYYGVNSRFALVTAEGLAQETSLQVRSRAGLTAKAQVISVDGKIPLEVGQLVQETVRVLPRNIGLVVALDNQLERIERVDATSAFATIAHVSGVVAGEQPADYIFGKLQQTPSRYGLFSLDGELISNTSGEIGEAVKLAVQRLTPKFQTLLAAKLWRLTENEGSSRLAVQATLEIFGVSPRIVMQRETVRTLSAETSMSKSLKTQHSESTAVVPIGSRMQYRVQNQSDRPVYLMLLGLKNNKTGVAFYPWTTLQETNISDTKQLLTQVVIPPGETLTLPQTTTASEWVVSGPAFFCEHQLILCTHPFDETLAALYAAKNPTTDQQPIGSLLNSLEVAQALLQDLHNAATTVKAEINGTAADSYVLDVNNWASFSFNFQVM